MLSESRSCSHLRPSKSPCGRSTTPRRPVRGSFPTGGTGSTGSAVDGPAQHGIVAIESPPLADRDDRLALFTDKPQVDHELLERVERADLTPAEDHFVCDGGIGETHRNLVLLGTSLQAVVALAPDAFQQLFDRCGSAPEGEIARFHAGRHHRDEIVAADQLVQRLDERALDVECRAEFDVLGVEEKHEEARAHVLRCLAHLGDRRRLAPRLLRSRAANDHVLETIDLLRCAFVEDFDLVLPQIRHRLAVGCRIHVDADVVDLGAEGFELGGRRWLLRGNGSKQEGQEARGKGKVPGALAPRPSPLAPLITPQSRAERQAIG